MGLQPKYFDYIRNGTKRIELRLFDKSIVCGELIFWMTEVSKAVSDDKLKELLERIIADGNGATPPKYNRIKWNKEIQNLCFDAIVNVVEKQ